MRLLTFNKMYFCVIYLMLLELSEPLPASRISDSDNLYFNNQCIRKQKTLDSDILETYIHSASSIPARLYENNSYLYIGPAVKYTQILNNQEWWCETNKLDAFNLTNYFECNFNSHLIFNYIKISNYFTNIEVIISNNGLTGFIQRTNWCGEEIIRIEARNVFSIKGWTTNLVYLIVHCHPELIISKEIANIFLEGGISPPLPGSAIEYRIYYTNASLYDGYGSNVIIYDKLPYQFVTFKSNSIISSNGWIIEYSTNLTPQQSYNSTNYSTNCPPVIYIKWIRWKKESVAPGEKGTFYFKVTIK